MAQKTRTESSTTGVPSYPWLFTTSSWIVLTLIPQGWFAWAGFLFIAIVGKRAAWGVLGVVSGVVMLLAQQPFWGEWQPVVALIVYLAGIVIALWLNQGWLRLMWERREARAAAPLPQPTAVPSEAVTAVGAEPRRGARRRTARSNAKGKASANQIQSEASTEPQRLAREAGAHTGDLLAARPDAEGAPAAAARSRGGSASAPVSPVPLASPEKVDVNLATAAELATLSGVTMRTAKEAVRRRETQGNFRSVDDFARVMKLQPHRIVKLREQAVCTNAPLAPRSFGRRVDY